MSTRRVRRPLPGRTRKGLRTTALVVTVVAALTASRAPALTEEAKDTHAAPPADGGHRPATGAPYADPAPPGDGSYHTEPPPLAGRSGVVSPAVLRVTRSRSGIPVTVLRAYRAAETSVGRTDPGCRLPWELLAAIGKVESGHAGGGAVGPDGTTTRRITGPALNGRGFALIRDTDGGSHDDDRLYDRAVGPMQFLPATWARWGTDGNGDGRADPDNVFDAALAAGHYLCAGDRDLGRDADQDEAILGYNHSRRYLELVRSWLAFYSGGVHAVPDGTGVPPLSPGAGGGTPAAEPADGPGGDGGATDDDGDIVVGPDPTPPGGPGPSPSAPSPAPAPAPASPTPRPSAPTTPPAGPEPSRSPGGQPTGSPSPSASPSASPDPTPEPTPTTTEPDDCATPTTTPSPAPATSPSPARSCEGS